MKDFFKKYGITILISAIIPGIFSIGTTAWTLSYSSESYACEQRRALANEITAITYKIMHTAQNSIGIGIGACYTPDGKREKRFQRDIEWNAEYSQMAVEENILSSKVSIFGDENSIEEFNEYLNSIFEFTKCKDENDTTNYWSKMDRETCEFVNSINNSLNNCFDIQATPITC